MVPAGTRILGPAPQVQSEPGRHQNSRAFFFRSFRFQRARRSNSSMLIPNTSWNSSGDKCLFKKKGGTRGER